MPHTRSSHLPSGLRIANSSEPVPEDTMATYFDNYGKASVDGNAEVNLLALWICNLRMRK